MSVFWSCQMYTMYIVDGFQIYWLFIYTSYCQRTHQIKKNLILVSNKTVQSYLKRWAQYAYAC